MSKNDYQGDILIMKHDLFAKWLKIVIAGTTLIGLTCCGYVIPYMGKIMGQQYPEFQSWILPWQIVIYICAIPCFIAMVISWKIASNIEKDNSFCMANARLFKNFSILALSDSVFFLLASIVFLIVGMNHPGLLLIDFLIVFFGMAVFVCTSALSYLVAKAASIQDENDLTI